MKNNVISIVNGSASLNLPTLAVCPFQIELGAGASKGSEFIPTDKCIFVEILECGARMKGNKVIGDGIRVRSKAYL